MKRYIIALAIPTVFAAIIAWQWYGVLSGDWEIPREDPRNLGLCASVAAADTVTELPNIQMTNSKLYIERSDGVAVYRLKDGCFEFEHMIPALPKTPGSIEEEYVNHGDGGRASGERQRIENTCRNAEFGSGQNDICIKPMPKWVVNSAGKKMITQGQNYCEAHCWGQGMDAECERLMNECESRIREVFKRKGAK